MSFEDIRYNIDKFKHEDIYQVMLIDVREPKEIERAKQAFNAKTILIENNRVKNISSNSSDANVFDYTYDFVIQNNGTLDEFRNNIYKFACAEILDA